MLQKEKERGHFAVDPTRQQAKLDHDKHGKYLYHVVHKLFDLRLLLSGHEPVVRLTGQRRDFVLAIRNRRRRIQQQQPQQLQQQLQQQSQQQLEQSSPQQLQQQQHGQSASVSSSSPSLHDQAATPVEIQHLSQLSADSDSKQQCCNWDVSDEALLRLVDRELAELSAIAKQQLQRVEPEQAAQHQQPSSSSSSAADSVSAAPKLAPAAPVVLGVEGPLQELIEWVLAIRYEDMARLHVDGHLPPSESV